MGESTYAIPVATRLMNGFARRSGLLECEIPEQRYLWTDAFGVMNYLSLWELTGDEDDLERAVDLVGRVHHTLGRRRADDSRTGWISGLSEEMGERRPTRGGLRIGKPLPERRPGQRADDRLEWERDGQYFHYLTKWMQALGRIAVATGDPMYLAWALELAETAYHAFVHRGPDGRPGIYWKMSVDLSRPLVHGTGQLDPLDGFVTYSDLQSLRGCVGTRAAGPDLESLLPTMREMCWDRSWATADALGIGGLLVEAGRLLRLNASGFMDCPRLLSGVLADAQTSLRVFADQNTLDRPDSERLAFRELGLAIGLLALRPMRSTLVARPRALGSVSDLLAARVDDLLSYEPLAERVTTFWLNPSNRLGDSWADHENINDVMLATCLVPHACLDAGPYRVAPGSGHGARPERKGA